ncbi:MAG: hypothetical protein GY754_27960 [bacterium]|nr:hypothetical protein [bacterium]
MENQTLPKRSPIALHTAHTPRLMLIIIMIGICLDIAASIFSVLYTPGSKPDCTNRAIQSTVCEEQRNHRKKKIADIQKQMKQDEKRHKALKEMYVSPEQPGFVSVTREQIEQLKARIDRQAEKTEELAKLDMKAVSVKREEAIAQVLLSIVLLIFFLIPAQILLKHAEKVFLPPKEKIKNIGKVYAIIVISLILIHLFREIDTSVLAPAKEWYGTRSFHISPIIWISTRLSIIGAMLAAGYIAALIFCLSGKKYGQMPDIEKPGTSCGTGVYTRFLQEWSLGTSIITFIPAIIIIKVLTQLSRGTLPQIYLLEFIPIIVLGMIIILRLIKRAVDIRFSYQEQVDKINKSWNEIDEMKLPPDPTAGFLGEHWWSLPASLSGLFALIWAFIKLTGLETLLLETLK